MSTLPVQLTDRWQGRDEPPDRGCGVVYWHMLLSDHQEVRRIAAAAQQRLSKFAGLHMTPLRWLHITTLIAGSTNELSGAAMKEMLEHAAIALSGEAPVGVNIGRIFYHPEAIVLRVQPEAALDPIRESAQYATRMVTGRTGIDESSSSSWKPHVTLCYSTSQQPAEPIIADLGTELANCSIKISTLSLVIQRGPERLWDWHPVGEVRLAGEA